MSTAQRGGGERLRANLALRQVEGSAPAPVSPGKITFYDDKYF
jgi:hypothetical protein